MPPAGRRDSTSVETAPIQSMTHDSHPADAPDHGSFSSRGDEPSDSSNGPASSFGAGVGSASKTAANSGSGGETSGDKAAPRRRSRGGRGGRGRRRPREAGEEGASTATTSPREAEAEHDAKPSAADRSERAPSRSRARESSATPARAADRDADTEEGTERPRRRRSRRSRSGTATTVENTEVREDAAPESDEEAKPKRSRRRARTRKRSTDEETGPAARDGEAPARRKRSPRVVTTKTRAAADEAPPAEGDGKKRKRSRRRGSRSKSESAPVEVDWLPGEEDELPPELLVDRDADRDEDSDDAGKGRKKSRRSRKRGGKKADAEDEDDDELASKDGKKSAAKADIAPNVILVNAADAEETRVAVVENELITEFQMTVDKHKTFVNDIYRGKVVNLEPAIGAAFVDFGQGRNGFLHTSDVLSAYGEKDWSLDKLLTTRVDPDEWEAATDRNADLDVEDGEEDGGRRRQRRGGRPKARPRLPVTDLLQRGQSVVVQVTKDAIGDKGPTLTTYISIPGRYLVLMPSMARTGVSRKIDDEKERRRLKRILKSLDVPEGMGVIVRTAGVGHTKADIKRDLDYLLALWSDFGRRLNLGRGPMALYEESDVAIRTMRDLFNEGTEAVWVDEEIVHARMAEFTKKLMPEMVDRIRLHDGSRPLFHAHGAEQDFERIFARRVELPSGGSIVFDQAEALVAIDVNSGKTRSDGFNFEEIALKANLEAVPEIARQIPLRDLGGIIVIDFIDMTRAGNRRTVERAFRDALARDRARSKLGRISQFGLLEMTRQRLGPGLSKMLFRPCQRCRGSGRVRTEASRAGAILRRLGSALTLKGFTKVEVRAHPEVIDYLLEHCSEQLSDLRDLHDRELILTQVPDQVEDSVLRYLRTDGREVRPGGRRKR